MADNMMEWSVRETREQIGPGSVVMDGWELKKLLGEGGSGTVWLAEKSLLGITDQSAIKIIRIPRNPAEIDAMRAEGCSEDSIRAEFRQNVERAVREIRTMIELKNHPAIVPCESFDVIQYEDDGTWEIVIRMQLLTSLTGWVSAKGLNAENAIRMGISLSDLLSVCEKKNILHRDIKPANIFVDQLDNFKLGDFGLARVVSDSNATYSKGVGTEAFMPPEVFKGDEYDHRADLYSLGLVMYWLLNRQSLPFTNDGSSRSDAIARRLSGEPLPALPGVDPALDEIIRKACDPDPEKRWKSAQEFHDALVFLQNGSNQTGSIYEPPQSKPEKKQTGIRTVLIISALLVVLLGVLDLTGVTHLIPALHPASQTEADVAKKTAEEEATKKVSDSIKWELTSNTLHIYGNGDMEQYSSYEDIPWYNERKKIKRVIIENGVTTIGWYSFYGCTNLEEVSIPESINQIMPWSFASCSSLKRISIPSNVISIEQAAFADCVSLEDVILSDNLTWIGQMAFYGCSSLPYIMLPTTTETIINNAFYGCSSLMSIKIPSSVTSIGDDVFGECHNLIIYCEADSCAEKYAKANGIHYERISSIRVVQYDISTGTTLSEHYEDISINHSVIWAGTVPGYKLVDKWWKRAHLDHDGKALEDHIEFGYQVGLESETYPAGQLLHVILYDVDSGAVLSDAWQDVTTEDPVAYPFETPLGYKLVDDPWKRAEVNEAGNVVTDSNQDIYFAYQKIR